MFTSAGPCRLGSTAMMLALLGVIGGCSIPGDGTSEGDLLGSWRVVTVDDVAVQPGVNTSQWPRFDFAFRENDGHVVSGNLGCNGWGAAYTVDGDQLILSEGSMNAMECVFDEEGGEAAAMQAELALSNIVFPGPLTAELGDSGTTLVLRSERGEVVLDRVGAPVDEESGPPVGPLECPGSTRVEELLAGSGLSQAEAARAADPRVVATDENLHTTFGLDDDGVPIVEVQNSDSAPGDFLIATCADSGR